MVIHIGEDIFGTMIDPITKKRDFIERVTLTNDNGIQVQVITYGAIIKSILVPTKGIGTQEVVFGSYMLQDYLETPDNYFGAIIGRVCNKLSHGHFKLDGNDVQLTQNAANNHHFNGGNFGLSRAIFRKMSASPDGVIMQYIDRDGHEGYPGQLSVFVNFELTDDNCLHIRMEALTTHTTVVNLTYHTYFNLSGEPPAKENLRGHSLMINASKMLEYDSNSMPTGRFTEVENTPFDFRSMCNLGERLDAILPVDGFDHHFCVENTGKMELVARVTHPNNGRCLDILSNQPGLQFYTANNLVLGEDKAREQKKLYVPPQKKQSGFCLMPQKYPDAVHFPHFPSIVLKPNEKYIHHITYKFTIGNNTDLATTFM